MPFVIPCQSWFPTVAHSLSSVIPVVGHSLLLVVPCCWSFPIIHHSHCLLFPVVGCFLRLVVPHRWSFPVVGRSLPLLIPHCPSFPLLVVPSHSSFILVVVISTSIPPYEQWLAGRVGVLCDVGLALFGSGCHWTERARCHPASRGSQRQCRGVSFGGWAMLLPRCKNLKEKPLVSKRNNSTNYNMKDLHWGPNDD